ncbi:MAG: family 20 glycosylhydrolase, partial [Chitinophagaceae bacterium]|nr:family 20 glycosylhydrolase [Chitinophagaceae bacterium]
MRILTSLISLLFAVSLVAQEPNIIPRPENLKWINKEKPFTLSSSTVIVLEGSNLEKTAAYLNAYLKKYFQYNLKVVKRTSSANVIRLNYERMDHKHAGAYMLRIDDKGIYLAGDNEEGVFNGVQTLIQLLPVSEAGKIAAKADIPSVYISDGPRFGYRGMHLDVARHFFPVDFIKKYIDYLALHKLNTFHWHLTDDQGWRIEIKKYPQLTTVGGWRNGTITGRYPGNGNDKQRYGGFYTQ